MFRLLVAGAVLLVNATAFAQVTCSTSQIGQFGYTNCSNGSSATTTTLGNQTYTTITPAPAPIPFQPAPRYAPDFIPLGKTR